MSEDLNNKYKAYKSFVAGKRTLFIGVPFADRGDVRFIATVTENGKIIDTLTSMSGPARSTNTQVKWFVEKHTPRGANWYTDFTNWWLSEGWPMVEPRTRNVPKAKWK